MPYLSDDPRSQLSDSGSVPRVDGAPLEMQYFDFAALEPDEVTPAGSRSWYVRGQNVTFALTELALGDTLARDDDAEVLAFTPAQSASLRVEAAGAREEVTGQAVFVLPPGTSSITAVAPTRLVRLFPLAAADVAAKCRNADVYSLERPPTAVTEPWPEPVGGSQLRVYGGVADIPRAPERLGRIFRNRHAMVNFLYPRVGPRDPSTLSPHLHDDFEQLSYADSGEHVHHIRAAWGPDRRLWREDEHVRIGSPSLAIIPPPLLHTSEASGDDVNQLIDIFAGPRVDFSQRPNWVLNAADYPAPAGVGA